jgi:hypothetical protein
MTGVNDVLLGVGAILLALAGLTLYIVDNLLLGETALQSKLMMRKTKPLESAAAARAASSRRSRQRFALMAIWVSGVVVSIIAILPQSGVNRGH